MQKEHPMRTEGASPVEVPVAVPLPVGAQNNSTGLAWSPPQVLVQSKPQSEHILKEDQVLELKDQGYTAGLVRALSSAVSDFPLRIWVLDNSGSMNKGDGQRVVEKASSGKIDISECSRWNELQDCVLYHVQLASVLHAPTKFRLLNNPGAIVGPQWFGIADEGKDDLELIRRDVELATRVMRNARPKGKTPLTQQILDIQKHLDVISSELSQQNRRVAIIIATDGLPTDDLGFNGGNARERFVNALKLLEGMPVWIVIRLCTDEDDVVAFYQSLDEELELSIELLDDFAGEAGEVFRCNQWLNYALPLHRCREFGFHHRVFDLIDERRLTKDQLRDFCVLLFGVDKYDGDPDPAVDWTGFRQTIDGLLEAESKQWNPAKKKLTPWIDVKMLDRIFGDGSNCACSIV